MKRTNLILSALFLLLSIGQLWAQEQKPHKLAVTFKEDTAQYLEYNYTIRSAQYKGKTVGDILKELEYPVLYIVESRFLTGPNMPTKVTGLSLGIRQVGEKPNPLKDYYLDVRFENPPTFEKYQEAGYDRNNPNVFSQKLYNFIKDLKISSVSSNEFILKDPEILKARKESFRQTREKQFEELKRAGMPEEEIDKIRKMSKD